GDALVVDDQALGDAAAIFYTSGTTGFPKGAVTSHGNFPANARPAAALSVAPEGLRTLISVPLFHVTGCAAPGGDVSRRYRGDHARVRGRRVPACDRGG